MTPDRLLTLLSAEAARAGHVCPQLDSPQAHAAAERLLAAVGLTRTTPPRALPPAPPTRIVDSPTAQLPVWRPGRHRVPPAAGPR